ncbi:hypothetical protein HDU91_007312 [Kappamyces sp. JEL0680]|nr:hypothetical protein HDU91_007312 [Kappamyces sp. JEL0680]
MNNQPYVSMLLQDYIDLKRNLARKSSRRKLILDITASLLDDLSTLVPGSEAAEATSRRKRLRRRGKTVRRMQHSVDLKDWRRYQMLQAFLLIIQSGQERASIVGDQPDPHLFTGFHLSLLESTLGQPLEHSSAQKAICRFGRLLLQTPPTTKVAMASMLHLLGPHLAARNGQAFSNRLARQFLSTRVFPRIQHDWNRWQEQVAQSLDLVADEMQQIIAQLRDASPRSHRAALSTAQKCSLLT